MFSSADLTSACAVFTLVHCLDCIHQLFFHIAFGRLPSGWDFSQLLWLIIKVKWDCFDVLNTGLMPVGSNDSGCVVEYQTCNRDGVGLNLGRDYFTPRSTQPSISLQGW